MNSKIHKYTNIVSEFSYMQIDCALAGVGKGGWSHNKKMNFLKITKLTYRRSKECKSLECFVFAFDEAFRLVDFFLKTLLWGPMGSQIRHLWPR